MERPFPIRIVLPGEPRGKGRPRSSAFTDKAGRAKVRVHTPERTRSYEAALAWAAKEAMGNYAPVDGPLAVTMTACFPIPVSFSRKKQAAALAGEIWPTKKPDFDNVAKCCDALNGIVWRDDALIVIGTVVKKYSLTPELRVVVRPAPRPTEELAL